MCSPEKEAKVIKKNSKPHLQVGLHIFTITNLKLFVLPLMLLDHIHYFFADIYNIPMLFKYTGRIVYPVFIFAITEGYYFTKDRKKYLLRLFISSLSMYLLNYCINSLLPIKSGFKIDLNIFTSMFFIILYLYILDNIKSKKYIVFNIITLIITLPLTLFIGGGLPYIFIGLLLYYFRSNRTKQILVYCLCCLFFIKSYQFYMIFAVIPFILYNAQKGKGYKYLFYLFYPIHVYILYIIRYLLS